MEIEKMFEELYEMLDGFGPIDVEKLKKEVEESESIKRIKEEMRQLKAINAIFKK